MIVEIPNHGLVEFPDHMNDADVTAAIKKITQPPSFAQQPSLSKNSLADETGPLQAALIGAGRTFDHIGKGMQQLYYGATNQQDKQDELKRRVANEDALYKPLSDAHPIATALGESLPSMAVPASAGVKGMMLAATVPGLLEYGTASERATKGAFGAGGSAVGNLAGNTAARLIKPFSKVDDPVRDSLLSTFKNNNIPLSAAQETGNNTLRWIDSALDNLPWVADKQLAAKQAQRSEFNRAVSKTFGSDETNLTPDILNLAKERLGQGFSDLSSRNRLNFTNNELNKVAQIQFDAQRYGTADHQRIVGNYIDDILNKVEPDGTISGDAYRKFDSALGRKIKSTNDGDLRHLLGDTRDIFRTAMDNSIGSADQQAWRDLRRQYANLQTVADTVKGSPTGEISPAGLLQRVNNQSKSAKFTGGGELGNLARAGKEILTPLPDSGTAQRAYWMRVLGGTGLLGGGGLGLLSPLSALGMATGAGIPLAVQNSMWNGTGRKYLEKGLINLSPLEEKALIRASNLGGVSAAKGLLNSMNDQ